jgi:hypothetical protein
MNPATSSGPASGRDVSDVPTGNPGPRIGALCTGYGGLDLAVEMVLGGPAAAGLLVAALAALTPALRLRRLPISALLTEE